MVTSMKVLYKAITLSYKAQLESYLVSYRIAEEKVPYIYGEKLILLSTVDMVSTILDEKLTDMIKCFQLSDTADK